MPRIRTVKPEFWTSEQILNLSPLARLLIIGLWNFCDDSGVHPASSRTLRAEVFPGDDISIVEVQALVDEMIQQGLVAPYEVAGKSYWHVTGWKRHQRIEKPTYKHPQPPAEVSLSAPSCLADHSLSQVSAFGSPSAPHQRGCGEDSTTSRREAGESSTTTLQPLPPGVEGNGVEGNGVDEYAPLPAIVVTSSTKDCPHEEIIALYHELLPTARRVREWTPARQQALRSRWREKPERQDLEWWRLLFGYIEKSDFLCGRTASPGRRPFELGLEWVVKPENLAKITEGAYHSVEDGPEGAA
jgi:hypothetical protein